MWASVSFNSGAPVNQVPSGMFENPGIVGVSVSDSVGHILFYSDGSQVLDSMRNIMPNGTGLLSGPNNHQSAFAVQNLINKHQYYLFTVGAPLDATYHTIVGLYYSVIDMTLHGGLGDIMAGQKNIPVTRGDSAISQITGIRHSNNKYAWVVVLNQGHTTNYQSYLIDSSGFHTIPVSSPSHFKAHINSVHPSTNMRISPDGRNLVCTDSLTQLCYFNDTTGVVTPRFTFHPYSGSSDPTWGKEFSINSHYLYVTSHGLPDSVVQYDMSSPDSLSFVQSKQKIGGVCIDNIQMAPDGKIYINSSINALRLSVINNPSVGGSGCNYDKLGFLLLNNQNSCLPQFLQRYKAYIHDSSMCQYNPVYFSGDIWPPPDSVKWNFGDLPSGSSNFSNLLTPSHTYSSPGTYTIELFVRHNDNRADTSWKTITIIPNALVSLGPNRTICIGDSTTFDAGACTGCTYVWKNLGTGFNVGNNQTYKTGLADTYAVIVTNSNGCIGADTIVLNTTSPPSVMNPPAETICSGQSTNVVLISNVAGSTFHWTASLTSGSITGFSTDSGLVINQVLTNLLTTAGIVTYQITPKFGDCSGTPVNYVVTVNPGDSVKNSITVSANNICTGTPVTFTSTPTNPGLTPVYSWQVNGGNAGTNSTTYTYTPVNGDVVKCILTSSLSVCISNNPATSNSIVMVVNPNLPVSVTLTSAPAIICAGSPITFTAHPTNGGTTPSYSWKVNAIGVGTNSDTYSFIPVNGDLVSCTLNSSETCTTNNPASSIQYPVTVDPLLPITVTITANANPVCSGITVNFTAVGFGGTTSSFQWQVNGINSGTNISTYSYQPNNGDQVNCTLTASGNCITGNPATSNTISMIITQAPIITFTACFDTITSVNAKPIRLKGGIPLNGTYSGAGVNSLTSTFNPATAGAGTKTITYSYTNAALCTASNHISILNLPSSIFNCGSTLTDIRDSKTYQTVQIGSQCWMAEDLNYGTEIPYTMDQRDNCIAEYFRYALRVTRNAYYQWDELMQYDATPADQGFCPPGWHVPSENDWNILFANYTSSCLLYTSPSPRD